MAVALAAAAMLLVAGPGSNAGAGTETTRYMVVLAGQETSSGFQATGTKSAILAEVTRAGGTVVNDLSRQIGVLVVDSPNALLDDVLRGSSLFEEAAEDFKWKAFPSTEQALACG
jgi:hypothetical protein